MQRGSTVITPDNTDNLQQLKQAEQTFQSSLAMSDIDPLSELFSFDSGLEQERE